MCGTCQLAATSKEEVAPRGMGKWPSLPATSLCTCMGVSVWLGIVCMLVSTLPVSLGTHVLGMCQSYVVGVMVCVD